ncbi:MAG: peptidase domain-containing ABC transporter [Bacteroidales bacterium]|nr:peptidase domain-containing ABC transporter [Bacteroidales bacterium]
MTAQEIWTWVRKKNFPFHQQLEANDCGPSCLRMICSFYGRNFSVKTIKKACNTTRIGSTVWDLLSASKELGFTAAAVKLSLEEVNRMPLPAILYWRQEHFVVLYKIDEKKGIKNYHVADPGFGKLAMPENIFVESFIGENEAGISIVLEPTDAFYGNKSEKFSLREEFMDIWELTKSTFKTHKKKFLFALVFSLLAMVANWLIPIVFQKMFDDGIGMRNLDLIKVLAATQFALFIGYIVSNNFSNILLSKVGYSLGISFLSTYLHKLIKLPISFFDTKANSDLIQLVEDQENLKSFLIYNLISFLFSFSNLIVFSGILIYYNVWVFLTFLFFSIISAIWSALFLKRRKILNYMRFSAASESKSNIYELIMGMREIKINSAQETKVAQAEKTQDKINNFNLQRLYLDYYSNSGVQAFSKLKDIVIIVFCAHFVVSGEMTLGVLMTISYLLGQLSQPFTQILEFVQEFQATKLSFDRLAEVQKHKNEDSDEKISPRTIQEGFLIKNASFKYAGGFNPYVLKNISARIPSGKVTAIVGASGSGKTTLLKILLSFYYPQEGDIYLDKNKMSDINADEWRKKCGVVMQDGYMFSGSIMDNIALADEKPDLEKMKKAARVACIDDFIEKLPMGYNTKIGNIGVDLSGGQKQRLLIARAVYKDPEFIFFDEATSFLDTTNEAKIMHNLKSFYKGKTVVIVAHRLSTVKDADNIIVLENGYITETGTHEELTFKKGIYYTLIKNQLELGQ